MSPAAKNNIYLITGDDEAVIKKEAIKLVNSIVGENPDPFALDAVCERDGTKPAQLLIELIRSAKSPSLLGGEKTVWLQHFSSFASEGAARSKTADAKAFRELVELIENGLPENVTLVMDGPKANKSKGLYKACKKHGAVQFLTKPKASDRAWQNSMRELITTQAKDKGTSLSSEVIQHLIGILGTDTARIDSELEKLICYAGGTDQPITLEAAEMLCLGQGEEVSWALTEALGKRNNGEALRIADVLLRQNSKDPDQGARTLLYSLANFYRQLLQIRILMRRKKCSPSGIRSLFDSLSPDEKRRLDEDGLEVVNLHPYPAQKLAEGSLRYNGQELVEAVLSMRDAFRRCITSSVPPRVVLEESILRITTVKA